MNTLEIILIAASFIVGASGLGTGIISIKGIRRRKVRQDKINTQMVKLTEYNLGIEEAKKFARDAKIVNYVKHEHKRLKKRLNEDKKISDILKTPTN